MDFMKWARYHWDRLSAAILAGVGLLTLLLGYIGVSGTVYPAEQLPYMISGGILGLFFLGTAGVLFLSADMRDEWRKLDSIDVALKELVDTTTLEPDDPAAEHATEAATDVVTSQTGTRRRTTRTTARQASGSAS